MPSCTAESASRALPRPLARDERRDVLDAVEGVDAGLVRFELDAELLLDEADQAERRQRIEDAAGPQRRVVAQVGRPIRPAGTSSG